MFDQHHADRATLFGNAMLFHRREKHQLFFEMVTLIQTKKISPVPIVLYGKDFWDPLYTFMTERLLREYKTIDREDLNMFHIVDSVEEAHAYILKQVDPCAPRQV